MDGAGATKEGSRILRSVDVQEARDGRILSELRQEPGLVRKVCRNYDKFDPVTGPIF